MPVELASKLIEFIALQRNILKWLIIIIGRRLPLHLASPNNNEDMHEIHIALLALSLFSIVFNCGDRMDTVIDMCATFENTQVTMINTPRPLMQSVTSSTNVSTKSVNVYK